MTLFGYQGLDAVDGSCCGIPIFLAYFGLIIGLSITAVVRRSGGFIALAFWIGALTGALILRPLLWAEQDEFADSVWRWWAALFCAPLVATVGLLLRRGKPPGDAPAERVPD